MLKFGKSVCIGNLFFTEKMILFIEIFGKKEKIMASHLALKI